MQLCELFLRLHTVHTDVYGFISSGEVMAGVVPAEGVMETHLPHQA